MSDAKQNIEAAKKKPAKKQAKKEIKEERRGATKTINADRRAAVRKP